ncbi:MAG TPA: hypothetical protein VF103_15135 [Polyangiaceae bacterium]
MTETAFSDLVARVRRHVSTGSLSPRIQAELGELEQRARSFGASEEELALAVMALLAVARAESGTP